MHLITLTMSAMGFSLPLAGAAALTMPNERSTNAAPVGEYYLLTSVIDGGDQDKNNLYVSGYHTGPDPSSLPLHEGSNADRDVGAGLNDVTLGSIDVASKGFFNDTHQQFDYNSSFPWAFNMGSDTNYAGAEAFHTSLWGP